MELSTSEDYWHQLSAHTNARLASGCPWTVQTYVAALVGSHEVSACVPQYSTADESTEWVIVAVTDDGRIILLRMTFDSAHHDLEGEQVAVRQRKNVTFVIHEASARRLSDAVRLDIQKVHGRPDGFGQLSRHELNLGDVTLTLRDGKVIDLGIDQTRLYDDTDLTRSDALIDAVRAHTGL